ncbi:1,2-phenylacetyl-CoA epoxidase subunit PaaD [Sphingomonas sp. PP-CC-3G-468]|uniref:1,2-phenylacetyl-CoA epoxidase subunit PaaD n=1 Tax=Sphingomonas sp. PP-CC-3G-468 TaxID=2135656 RepID=UPI00104E6E7D|nr:1,2-phenylacetyl-CoA epoxidase subunit PaaD [Sphingomonas sp. PP-CC-3G-468]TCM02923.1 ring-1,2-phenylacetyl-CoA epoxidase subunit PaaD [Sphingomonas sp. PP-CC-3G-468]
MVALLDSADRIREAIADVPDPEIPAVTLADLGIIRDVRVRDDGGYEVLLTPTYTGCPATLVIETSVRIALDRAGLCAVAIRSVLSPPWTTDWISDAGRDKLHAYGIAPPARGDGRGTIKDEGPATCPQCGSVRTTEISRFGSTPCKALWRCEDCAEPFDRFKCI